MQCVHSTVSIKFMIDTVECTLSIINLIGSRLVIVGLFTNRTARPIKLFKIVEALIRQFL